MARGIASILVLSPTLGTLAYSSVSRDQAAIDAAIAADNFALAKELMGKGTLKDHTRRLTGPMDVANLEAQASTVIGRKVYVVVHPGAENVFSVVDGEKPAKAKG